MFTSDYYRFYWTFSFLYKCCAEKRVDVSINPYQKMIEVVSFESEQKKDVHENTRG